MPADESSSASLTRSDYASFFEHSPVPTAVPVRGTIKAFVELLGGQIRMESEPGNGSEFTFWIPCAEVKEEKSGGLTDGGIAVIEAVDGQDAIDVFRQSHPAVILMDIRMPGIDGLAATGAIRSMKDAPHQPLIIALTGNAFDDDKEKAFAAGCDVFLAKPFRLEDLTEILSNHLGERCLEVAGKK